MLLLLLFQHLCVCFFIIFYCISGGGTAMILPPLSTNYEDAADKSRKETADTVARCQAY